MMESSSGSGLRNVTVSPSALDSFARFLTDHVADELTRLGGLSEQLAGRADFGEYDRSEIAAQRHTEAALNHRDRARQLSGVATGLAEATRSVAGGYRAVEDVNAAGSQSAIGSMLA